MRGILLALIVSSGCSTPQPRTQGTEARAARESPAAVVETQAEAQADDDVEAPDEAAADDGPEDSTAEPQLTEEERLERSRSLMASLYPADGPSRTPEPHVCAVSRRSQMDGEPGDGGYTHIRFRPDGLPVHLEWDSDAVAAGGGETYRYRRGALARIDHDAPSGTPFYRGRVSFSTRRIDGVLHTTIRSRDRGTGITRTWLNEDGRVEATSTVDHPVGQDAFHQCSYDEQGRIVRIRRSEPSEDGTRPTDSQVLERTFEYDGARLVAFQVTTPWSDSRQRVWAIEGGFVVASDGETHDDYDHEEYRGACQSYFFRDCSTFWNRGASTRTPLPEVEFGLPVHPAQG